MFTGITQTISRVVSAVKKGGGLEVSVLTPRGWRLKNGESVAVSGVCSTVMQSGRNLKFFYMPETLDKTHFAALKPGDEVNMERSLKASDRLDGHIVLGHVDTVGIIKRIKTAGESKTVTVFVPDGRRLLAPKASVALEGVSLTTAAVRGRQFTVHLIPYTWQHTNFSTKQAGDRVNVEFDILAKYLASLTRL